MINPLLSGRMFPNIKEIFKKEIVIVKNVIKVNILTVEMVPEKKIEKLYDLNIYYIL